VPVAFVKILVFPSGAPALLEYSHNVYVQYTAVYWSSGVSTTVLQCRSTKLIEFQTSKIPTIKDEKDG
jgi:hypothetical protein